MHINQVEGSVCAVWSAQQNRHTKHGHEGTQINIFKDQTVIANVSEFPKDEGHSWLNSKRRVLLCEYSWLSIKIVLIIAGMALGARFREIVRVNQMKDVSQTVCPLHGEWRLKGLLNGIRPLIHGCS